MRSFSASCEDGIVFPSLALIKTATFSFSSACRFRKISRTRLFSLLRPVARAWVFRLTTTPRAGRCPAGSLWRVSREAIHRQKKRPRAKLPFATRFLKVFCLRSLWSGRSRFRSFNSNLGQAFPALATAAPEDFSPAFSASSGKEAVLGTTFSFGRLIGSFHGF